MACPTGRYDSTNTNCCSTVVSRQYTYKWNGMSDLEGPLRAPSQIEETPNATQYALLLYSSSTYIRTHQLSGTPHLLSHRILRRSSLGVVVLRGRFLLKVHQLGQSSPNVHAEHRPNVHGWVGIRQAPRTAGLGVVVSRRESRFVEVIVTSVRRVSRAVGVLLCATSPFQVFCGLSSKSSSTVQQ